VGEYLILLSRIQEHRRELLEEIALRFGLWYLALEIGKWVTRM
jgi:hypothetical protein